MWLAASACPDDSSMLGLLLAIRPYAYEEVIGNFLAGCCDSCGCLWYAERKVGFTLSEGLWLAASACPHGSRMFRLLRVFLVRSKQEMFREGCQIDQCAAKSIKSDHNQGLAHQMLVVTIRGD